LEAGTQAEVIPPYLKDLCSLLLEVFQLLNISVAALGEVTAAGIHRVYDNSTPTKIEAKLPGFLWHVT
jgi:hypothetical protein